MENKSQRPLSQSQSTKINRKMISTPSIEFTARALQEIQLIIENDFTLRGRYFRILISGKGCDGFNYSTGFTEYHEDDFLIKIKNNIHMDLQIIIDPFAAFYLQKTRIDFIQNFKNNTEGFTVINKNQNEFSGKFWKEFSEKTPPLILKS